MEQQKPQMSWKVGVALLAGIVVIVAVLIMVAKIIGADKFPQFVGLPILAITGLVLLIATLAIVATVFALFGIADSKQALGLPAAYRI